MNNIFETTYQQTGNSITTNEMGMREMQKRVYEKFSSQYLLLKAPFKVLTSKNSNGEMKTEAIIMVLWFCALNGLSVYNTIIFDLRNLFMVFALGKCLQNYGLIRKY